MTSDTADLLFENLVVEAGLEFSLASGGGCDVHGGLATTEDDEIFLGGNGCAVEGSVGDVGLENLKIAGVDDLLSSVS